MNEKERVKIIKEAFENAGFENVKPFTKGGWIVGWTGDSYNDLDMNMGFTLDFRNEYMNPLNFGDIIDAFALQTANVDLNHESMNRIRNADKLGINFNDFMETITTYYDNLSRISDNFYLQFVNNEIIPYLTNKLVLDNGKEDGETIKDFMFKEDIFSEKDYDPRTFGLKELNKLLNNRDYKSVQSSIEKGLDKLDAYKDEVKPSAKESKVKEEVL